MPFQYRHARNGRRVLIEERNEESSGRSDLVVVAVDGVFSEDEIRQIYADAMAAWLYPAEPPPDWFE